MSYICGNCHVSQPPRTPAIPIVVETRKVEYTVQSRDPENDEAFITKVVKGSEVVKEVRVCPGCADELRKVVK